ncbi:hypothetical protein [Rhodococcus sp. HNM0569]|uniref:hypothetical protein n=1 Tax=Rhodococcus sp. HNM0569 TaxID=2716340 RepID=UPI00146EDB89|nr:hypothetical protein [Rhodococcus sp. HNM0569]NLU82710.1 hypothetical protein [Rhodococcus sp. HNM0569]
MSISLPGIAADHVAAREEPSLETESRVGPDTDIAQDYEAIPARRAAHDARARRQIRSAAPISDIRTVGIHPELRVELLTERM